MQPTSLDWLDSEEIGIALFELDSETNPLTVRFTDLIEMVIQLPAFSGDRDRCNEKILEAIQMAWLEEFNEEQS